MNSLSLLIYAAEVVPNLSVFMFVVGLASFCVIGLVTAIVWMSLVEDSSSYKKERSEAGIEKLNRGDQFKYIKWGYFGMFLMVLSLFTPSKQTIYLIAGSEVGEAVVTSDEGQKIMSDIHAVIKHQLQELKGE